MNSHNKSLIMITQVLLESPFLLGCGLSGMWQGRYNNHQTCKLFLSVMRMTGKAPKPQFTIHLTLRSNCLLSLSPKLTCNWLISHLGNFVGILFRGSIDSYLSWLLISFCFSNDSICSDRWHPPEHPSSISHSWVGQNPSTQWFLHTRSLLEQRAHNCILASKLTCFPCNDLIIKNIY